MDHEGSRNVLRSNGSHEAKVERAILGIVL